MNAFNLCNMDAEMNYRATVKTLGLSSTLSKPWQGKPSYNRDTIKFIVSFMDFAQKYVLVERIFSGKKIAALLQHVISW